ncbi:MAG: hypothetical protein BWZ04_00736 [Firmicutes bacterium ADurb.BinA205]|nr:MAG: hypothetical protein BWZ04_00736 [Firmicutes bacterium ADurb.BinA205]
MQNYCIIVKNKLNMLIRNMEKNKSDFVVDPKRDFGIVKKCAVREYPKSVIDRYQAAW